MTKKILAMDGPERAVETAAPSRPSRTNLLLSASIEAGTVSGPVRIRNLSESGALLEGATLPPVGARLTLRRLALEIGATVIWIDRGRCGVRFDGTISVAGWRQGNWIAPVGGMSVPSRTDLSAPDAGGGEEFSYARCDALIADELTALRLVFENLGTQLVQPTSEAERIVSLQQFDTAAQTLGYLADVLKSEDRVKAIEGVGSEGLRRRLQALRPEKSS